MTKHTREEVKGAGHTSMAAAEVWVRGSLQDGTGGMGWSPVGLVPRTGLLCPELAGGACPGDSDQA